MRIPPVPDPSPSTVTFPVFPIKIRAEEPRQIRGRKDNRDTEVSTVGGGEDDGGTTGSLSVLMQASRPATDVTL